jgi:hypothetical protein
MQNQLRGQLHQVDQTYKKSFDDLSGIEQNAKNYQDEIKMLKKEIALKKETMQKFQKVLDNQPVFKCHVCANKIFATQSHLDGHYKRRHPDLAKPALEPVKEGLATDKKLDELKKLIESRAFESNMSNVSVDQTNLIEQMKKAQQEELEKIRKQLDEKLDEKFRVIHEENLAISRNFSQVTDRPMGAITTRNDDEIPKIHDEIHKLAARLEDFMQVRIIFAAETN